MPLSAGDKLGPYEILGPIGAGGMGEVYKAHDARLERIVAIKQFKHGHKARFQQEARLIAALNHPHICQVFDIGSDYLVMEYIEGRMASGPLRVDSAVKLALEIASGIEAAHGKGILHRDLKPANILVTAGGSAKILDFGLAKLMTESNTDATMTTEGTVLGTLLTWRLNRPKESRLTRDPTFSALVPSSTKCSPAAGLFQETPLLKL